MGVRAPQTTVSVIEASFTTWEQLVKYQSEHPDFADVFREWQDRGIGDKGFYFDLEAELKTGNVVCTIRWMYDYIVSVSVIDRGAGTFIFSHVRAIS
jgi:hypothetical protein